MNMGFGSIWLTTIIMTIIFEFKNEFKMFKDFADMGYKINTDKLTDLSKIAGDAINSSFIATLIPFYNITSVILKRKKYEDNKELIFDQYMRLGILEEMSSDEYEEYKKHPTGINAVLVPIKKEVQKENEKILFGTITIKEPSGLESVVNIKLDLNKENKDDMIEIITARGPISKLSKDEQVKFIREHLIESFRKGVSKFGNSDAFIHELCKNESVDVSDIEKINEDKTLDEVKPLSRLERYKQLKQSIEENGFLYGEEMFEYKELKEEFDEMEGPKLKLK